MQMELDEGMTQLIKRAPPINNFLNGLSLSSRFNFNEIWGVFWLW
jgi:hypothetical protein